MLTTPAMLIIFGYFSVLFPRPLVCRWWVEAVLRLRLCDEDKRHKLWKERRRRKIKSWRTIHFYLFYLFLFLFLFFFFAWVRLNEHKYALLNMKKKMLIEHRCSWLQSDISKIEQKKLRTWWHVLSQMNFWCLKIQFQTNPEYLLLGTTTSILFFDRFMSDWAKVTNFYYQHDLTFDIWKIALHLHVPLPWRALFVWNIFVTFLLNVLYEKTIPLFYTNVV